MTLHITTRFFLSSPDGDHWYVVPCDHAAAWEKWCAIPEDDERRWKVPRYATQVDGPHVITFADWCEGPLLSTS